SAALLASLMLESAEVSRAALSLMVCSLMAWVTWRERRYRYKKPLVLTERARRIRRLAAALLVPLVFLGAQHALLAVLVIQAVPLVLIAADTLLTPLQMRINDGFVDDARDRLARMNPVRIGITGSFGKTTVKHMLGEILAASGPVFYSRGSINTILGLTRHIRERLQWSHRYFIAEMGAYGEGSIQRLCDFAAPGFGIVTAVGDAHTERFGGIDAIARAKSELVQNVCAGGGIAVINAAVLDHEPFRRLREQYAGRVITVGPQEADVVVTDTSDADGLRTVALKSAVPSIPSTRYTLPLLGEHNVINSALAVTLALAVDPSIADDVPFFTKELAQVPHRLQRIDHPGQPLILDDAYNANEKGFVGAVTVLSELAEKRGGRAILVTPGITELGLEHDRVHGRLGAVCSDRCDVVYVVNPERIRSFTEALDRARVKVVEVATFADARRAIGRDANAQDAVLYENDLPDVLEERRLL
ncbi:MAG: Mur ligase family protein, partial [Pseudomonadota bacterium]